tara:strand:- start:643 stop:1458 length:816 start_codon:yes stop_codon:yes gene_type:complete
MERIQIGIPCGYNSELYVNFLLDSIRKTISNTDRVQILLGQNKPGVDINYIVEKNTDFDVKVIQAFSKDINSLGHAKCIDVLFEHMNLKYGMIVDCDVAFLEKNWDIKLLSELQNNKVVIGAGTSKEHHHYYNFPFTIMVLFEVEPLRKHAVSFEPYIKNGFLVEKVLTKEEAEIFGRKAGDKIKLDTAWQMPLKLKSNGYDGIALSLVTPRDHTSKDIKFMTPEMRGEEQQLNGIPFFTHVGRSATRPFNGPITSRWSQRVLEWIDGRQD